MPPWDSLWSPGDIQTLTSPTWWLIYNGRWFRIPRIYFWGWLYTTTFKSCLCGRSPKYTLTTPGYLKVKLQNVRSGCHAWPPFHLTKDNKCYDLLLKFNILEIKCFALCVARLGNHGTLKQCSSVFDWSQGSETGFQHWSFWNQETKSRYFSPPPSESLMPLP